jgi:N-acetylneuraminic acid mutarotase
MATKRAGFGICKLSEDDVYVTGGWGIDDVRLSSVERYDSSLNTWSTAPPLPWPRYAHCACAVGDAMYVLGGIEQNYEEGKDDEGGRYETVKSVLKFDCRMQMWSEVAPMPAEREDAGACVIAGNIYVFGGNTDDEVPTSTTYCFNTERNEWTTLAPIPEAMQGHSVCVLDGLIYLIGGKDDHDNTLSSVHCFDPVTNIWSAVAPIPTARMTLGSFVMDGNMYAVAGADEECRSLSSMERYSVASDSWSEVRGGELGTARNSFGALVVQLEVGLFDSLIAQTKSGGL